MPKDRTNWTAVVAAMVILGGGAVVAVAATGSVPFLGHAWEALTSSVKDLAPPSTLELPRATDAGARVGDAGEIQRRQTAPLSSAQLGAPLVHGTFVNACGAPDDMKVVVKVTVKMGRAVNVNVKTQPPDPTVASCIERATHDLKWDISPHSNQVTVTY